MVCSTSYECLHQIWPSGGTREKSSGLKTQLDSSVWAQHVPPDNESMQSSVVSLSQWIYWSQVRLLLSTNKCWHEKRWLYKGQTLHFTETLSVFHKCCVFVKDAVFCEILRLMKSFCVSWKVVAFFIQLNVFLCFLSCFFTCCCLKATVCKHFFVVFAKIVNMIWQSAVGGSAASIWFARIHHSLSEYNQSEPRGVSETCQPFSCTCCWQSPSLTQVQCRLSPGQIRSSSNCEQWRRTDNNNNIAEEWAGSYNVSLCSGGSEVFESL